MLVFSRRLALVGGVLVPLLETLRRWHQLADLRIWPFWLDDVIIGALLLAGAWRTAADPVRGRLLLAAAWGVACGAAYGSVFAQLATLDRPDPSGAPPIAIVAIKSVGLILAIVGLITTLRASR